MVNYVTYSIRKLNKTYSTFR